MKRMKTVYHELEPVYDENAEILILGTMPSPKSRELQFYYAHPQNRFWKVLEVVFAVKLRTQSEKRQFLLEKHIALWDVVSSCTIKGASDSSIMNVVPNDIMALLEKTKIHSIFTTGKKAESLYQKYLYPKTKLTSVCLPSTSPANCAVNFEDLVKNYKQIKKAIEGAYTNYEMKKTL